MHYSVLIIVGHCSISMQVVVMIRSFGDNRLCPPYLCHYAQHRDHNLVLDFIAQRMQTGAKCIPFACNLTEQQKYCLFYSDNTSAALGNLQHTDLWSIVCCKTLQLSRFSPWQLLWLWMRRRRRERKG